MKEKTALCIIGAYRDFFKNGPNFEKMLEFITNEKDIVIFAYLSNVSEYQRWHNSLFNKRNLQYYREENGLNEKILLDKINKYKIPYVLQYYNSCNDIMIVEADGIKNNISLKGKKNLVSKQDTFLYQMILEKRCSNIIKKYENENNVYFSRIIKTRPDLFYTDDFFSTEIINTECFFTSFDFLYICNREIYDKLMTKIEYLDFTNYIGHKYSLYAKLFTKIYEKYPEKKNEKIDLNHSFNENFLDLFGIKYEYKSVVILVRFVIQSN